jgi:crotonobetainyl-CoA:carnitine CoA-transferase CaiB-like acyl-CoA transferase
VTATALEGLRVLDMSILYSAPQIAAMLGDLGADVVKLEPPRGDPMRITGAQRNGHSLQWVMVSRNKRAITLDVAREEGQAVLRRLVANADVLLENLPVATLERWHCTYDELAAVNPRLVMVSVTCYGHTGPYSDRPGNGSLAEAYGGLTYMTGEEDGPPMLPSIPLGDSLTALSGVIGALAACYHRDARGGLGQHVDVTMYEPVLQMLAATVVAYDGLGEPPHRTGSRVPGGVPRNVYRTRDGGWVVISGTTDRQVGRILGVMGIDTPEARERYGRSEARLAVADELDARVAAWAAEHDREHVVRELLAAQIPVAPVNDLREIRADAHIAARGSLVELDDPNVGTVTMVAPAPRLGRTPGRIRTTGPALGEHNREVYAEWIGMPDEELAALREAGVV